MLPHQRVLRYQNSYRLEAHNPFNRDEVERILAKVIEIHFSNIEKFEATSIGTCRACSDDAMNLIKTKNYDR